MVKVQIEVEIPDGHEVVDVIPDVSIYEDQPCANRYTIFSRPTNPFEICGQPSEWPEWLTWDWVAADDHGRVHGYNDVKPFLAQQCYACGRGTVHHGSLFGIDIKIPGPWEQSLRENPRRKK